MSRPAPLAKQLQQQQTALVVWVAWPPRPKKGGRRGCARSSLMLQIPSVVMLASGPSFARGNFDGARRCQARQDSARAPAYALRPPDATPREWEECSL
jgi:hypothetical protein